LRDDVFPTTEFPFFCNLGFHIKTLNMEKGDDATQHFLLRKKGVERAHTYKEQDGRDEEDKR